MLEKKRETNFFKNKEMTKSKLSEDTIVALVTCFAMIVFMGWSTQYIEHRYEKSQNNNEVFKRLFLTDFKQN